MQINQKLTKELVFEIRMSADKPVFCEVDKFLLNVAGTGVPNPQQEKEIKTPPPPQQNLPIHTPAPQARD